MHMYVFSIHGYKEQMLLGSLQNFNNVPSVFASPASDN